MTSGSPWHAISLWLALPVLLSGAACASHDDDFAPPPGHQHAASPEGTEGFPTTRVQPQLATFCSSPVTTKVTPTNGSVVSLTQLYHSLESGINPKLRC